MNTITTTGTKRLSSPLQESHSAGRGLWRVIALFLIMMLGAAQAAAQTPITSWADLDNVRNNLSEDYVLNTNLDSSSAGYNDFASATANGNQGWEPIGSPATPFTGTFDGNGNTISGLRINRLSEDDIGLFGVLGSGADIHDLNMSASIFTNAGDRNGALAGATESGSLITNVHVSDHSGGGLRSPAGGLVGDHHGTITGSSATMSDGNVSNAFYGGLVGRSSGNISDSSSSLVYSFEGFRGGMVGEMNGGVIENCVAGGSLTSFSRDVGGFVARMNGGEIRSSRVTSGSAFAFEGNAGGFVGLMTGGLIENSYTVISAEAGAGSEFLPSENSGGFVASMTDGTIRNSYATGDAEGGFGAGSFVGSLSDSATIENSYAMGRAISPAEYLGGFAGDRTGGTITNGFWNRERNVFGMPAVGFGSDAGITGLVTAQMIGSNAPTNMGSFDYDDDWYTVHAGIAIEGETPVSDGSPILRGLPIPPQIEAVGAVLVKHTVTYDAQTGGSVEGFNPQTIIDGEDAQEVTAIAGTGYSFTQWSDENTNAARTDTNITGNVSFTAEFESTFIEINSWADLHNVRNDLSADYILMSDLGPGDTDYDTYASGTANSGQGWEPIGSDSDRFTGEFDGNGRVISGLVIDRLPDDDIGLFGAIGGGALLSNIRLEDLSIDGNQNVGGIVGNMRVSTITGSYVSGVVNAGEGNSGSHVGGIVGRIFGASVNTVFVEASSSSASVSGNNFVGGIVGFSSQSGSIIECYSSGVPVSREGAHAGGIAGRTEGSIVRSYATGTRTEGLGASVGGVVGTLASGGSLSDSYSLGDLSGTTRVGGVVGQLINSASVSSTFAVGVPDGSGTQTGGLLGENTSSTPVVASYWNSEINDPALNSVGVGSDDGITGLVTEDMKHPASGLAYVGWDFDTVWNDGSSMLNDGYPYLQWQTETFSLEYAAGPNGSIDTSDEAASRLRIPGASSTVTAVPASGFVFVQWSDEVTDNPRTDSNITANVNVTAEFAQGFTLEYSAGPSGSVDGNLNQFVAINGSGTPVTANAEFGYAFTQWSDEVTDNPRTDLNVTANVNVTAEFELEPIEINSWADLNSMRDNLGLSYVLMTDLGLSDAGYDDYASGDANGGLGWEPIGTPSARFTGEFDGNGRVISGLVIDRISDNDIGFFGATGGGALLSNIHLVDVDVLGNERVGGLVGDMGASTITSSHVSGSVSAGIASAGYNIGGLVGSTIETGPINTYILSSGSSATIRGFTAVGGIAGRMTSAVLIQECYYTGIFLPRSGQAAGMIAGYVDGRIERSYSGGVMQHTILFPNSIGGVGGLIFPDAVITDSYSVSDIRGWNRTGGLVGYLPTDATISRSFSTGVASSGSVTGEHIGGFIGRNLSSIPVTSSYWNSEVNPTLDGVGDGSSDGVTGLTTEQMKYPASGGAYAGWDFDTVWSDGSSMLNDGYPYLQWQTETISVEYAAGTGGSIDTSDESATRTRIPGANSTVTAVPDSGFRFVQWSDEVTDNPRTDVSINADISVTAEFIQTFTLDYAAGTGGSIDGDDEQIVDINTDGDPVEAIADSGFRFVQWSDESTDNPRTDLNVTANVNVTAEFVQTFTLDYAAGPGGDVSGNLSQVVDINTNGTPVEAEPDSGFRFVQWSDESTQNPRTDTNVMDNISVTAEFELDVIEINSWADLNDVRSDLSGIYILMTDLGPADAGYDDFASGEANGGLGWEPIGTPAARFTGEFDGNGNTISGLVIDRLPTDNIGFFGAIGGGATLSNIRLEDVDVNGNIAVGGLVGNMSASTITGSHVSGSVNAGTENLGFDVGGLVGITIDTGSINTYILSSGSTATVGGTGTVGGIAGRTTSAVLIQECYYAGTFLPRSGEHSGMIAGRIDGQIERSYSGGTTPPSLKNSSGGAVGTLADSASITDSYSVSDNNGALHIGGFVGIMVNNTVVSRSFSTGVVTSSFNPKGGFIGTNTSSIPVTSSYWNSEVNPTLDGVGDGSSDGITGLTTEQMKFPAAAGAYDGWDFDTVWNDGSSMLNDGYPYHQWQTETFSVEYAAGTGGSIDTSDESATRARIPGANSTVTAVPNSGYRFVQWSDEVTDNPRTDVSINADISVTAEFAQQVTTWQQLHEMRNNLSGNYILMNDLGPSDAGYTIYAGPAANGGLGWEPVGAFGDLFTGSLDGNGFTISGLTIDRTTDAYVGLFGVTSGGTIENLALSDVDIIGEDSVGAFSGLMIGGEIVNSSSSGTVAGTLLRVGGLVGELSNSTIIDSYSTAEIDGLGSAPLVGGLVGQMSGNSLIERSFAAGDISGESGVGGLVGMVTGSNCSIVDSYATGNVALLGISGGGGLVGSNDEGLITGSYATGSVTGSDVGGLVGIDTGTITNSYYNNDTAGDGAGSPYGTALNTGQMTGVNAATNMTGFDFTDVWTTVVDGVDVDGEMPNNNGYPVLKGLPVLPQLIAVGGLITQYTLTYNAGTGGSISGPNPQTVAEGGNGTPVEAEPASGFRFVQWSDESTDNPRTDLNVTANVNVTAEFIQTFTVVYNVDAAEGSITGNTNQVVDLNGDASTVTAEAATGFTFSQWSDGVLTAERTDTDVTGNINVTAEFEVSTFTLAYTTDGNGTINGEANQIVNFGEDGTAVTAEPAAGYSFTQWSDGVLTAERTDTNITADLSAEAQFGINAFTVTYTADVGGNIVGNANQTVEFGDDAESVTAEAETGYSFVQWSDGNTNATRTDTNITENVSFNAVFVIDQFTLVYNADPIEGFIDGDDNQTVDFNTDGDTVEAIANAGFRFVQWSDESTENPRTDLDVTTNVNVTAEFVQTFTLDYAAGPGGDVSGNLSQVVDINTNGTPVEAEPDTGFRFVQWSDESTENPRTDLNVTENVNVTAEFVQTFTLDYAAGPGGSIDGDESQTVDEGESGTTVTAEPDAGFRFDQWSDESTENPRTDLDVTANVNVTAEFVQTFTLDYAAGTGGSIGGDDEQVVDINTDGDPVEAIADSGFRFVQWSDESTENPRTDLNVTANVNVTAQFVQVFTLTYSAGTGGTITGNTEQVVDINGDATTVTAEAATGYTFSQWSDGILTAERTDTDVTTNINVTAEFTLNNYALVYAAGPNGQVTGNLSQNVDHGESGTPVTAEPDTDFVFVQWSDSVTDNPRTDTNVTGPVNVTAEFAQSVFSVVYTAGDNGSITGTATQNVADGNNTAPVTATPAPGYTFIQWDDGSTDATRFEENVTENLSFTATFADVTAPVSSLDVTTNTTRAGATVSLDYTVVELGSGLDEVELFVRAPGSATFEPTGVTSGDLTGTFVYTGTDGNGLYEFATAAVDNDTNAEATPTDAEVAILWNLVENADFTMEVTSADHTTTHPMTNDIDILISIQDAEVSGTITVSRTPGNNAPGTALDANKLLDEFITITGDGLGTGWTATITWNFDPDNALGIDGNLDMVFQFDGTIFVNQYPVTGTNPLTIGPITSFSDWYAGDASSGVDEWMLLND